MKRRTYLDASVLIHAWRGMGPLGERAWDILNDRERTFLSSAFVALEVIPTAVYHRDIAQQAFFRRYQMKSEIIDGADRIIDRAFAEGAACGTAGIDACHLAAAVLGIADELITAEKPTRPLCRAKSMSVVSLHWPGLGRE